MLFTVLLRVNTYQSSCSNQSFEANFVGCLVYRMFLRCFFFLLLVASPVQGTFISCSAVWKAGITKELAFPKAQWTASGQYAE